jgi:hypothetical protein
VRGWIFLFVLLIHVSSVFSAETVATDWKASLKEFKIPDAQKLHLDLVDFGRKLSRKFGMLAARQYVTELVQAQDASSGAFMSSFEKALFNSDYSERGSLSRLSKSERSKVLFLFANGLGQVEGDFSVTVVKKAIDWLRTEGYQADSLIFLPYGGGEINGRLIASQIKDAVRLNSVDSLILVGLSKGVQDIVYSLSALSGEPKIAKIRAVVSISGVVRSSIVARWLLDSYRPTALLLRRSLLIPFLGNFTDFEGIKSLATDPWEKLLQKGLPSGFRPIWINFVMLPNGPDGFPTSRFLVKRTERSLRKTSFEAGPFDGLVESAASILPPGTGLTQWNILLYGSHGLVDGRFLDGNPLTPVDRKEDPTRTGERLMDAVLRILPQKEEALARNE